VEPRDVAAHADAGVTAYHVLDDLRQGRLQGRGILVPG
jgi:hypothetical protein